LPRQRPTSDTIRYEQVFSRPVRVSEFNRPMLTDDVETAQTVAMMDELSEKDAAHRSVIEATHKALADAGLTMECAPRDKAAAIYWFLKRTIRYVPTPGTSPLVDQTLIPPASLLAMPDPEGDCPQFSMLAAAMFRVCCMESFFKTIAADPAYPATYSHIYNVVKIGPDEFMPFDSSNGPAPGAEYARPLKRRIWPQLRKVRCAASPPRMTPRKGNQMVRERTISTRSNRNAVLRSQMRGGHLFFPLQGVGDVSCDEDGNCYDTDTGTFTAYTPDLPTTVYNAAAPPVSYSPAPTPLTLLAVQSASTPGDFLSAGDLAAGGSPLTTMVTTSSGSTMSLAAALAADATQIVTPIVKAATSAPYYITGPNGQQVLYNPATGQAVGSSLSSLLTPTTMLIGLVVLGALLFSGKK
jgi:hypothetical protein